MAVCILKKLKILELLSPWGWTPSSSILALGGLQGFWGAAGSALHVGRLKKLGSGSCKGLQPTSRVDALMSKRWRWTRTQPCSSLAPLYIWLLSEGGKNLPSSVNPSWENPHRPNQRSVLVDSRYNQATTNADHPALQWVARLLSTCGAIGQKC